MCHTCWVAAGRHQNSVQQQDDDMETEPPVVGQSSISIAEYRKAANTSRRCMFPNCRSRNLLRIPEFMKKRQLIENKLYIPTSARVCNIHLDGNSWADLNELNDSAFTADQIKDMLDTLVTACNENQAFNFDTVENITTEELHFSVGLTHEQFERILQETPSLLEVSRRPKTVLGAYLMKIRSGEPNERLAARLGISRRTFERKVNIARQRLLEDFVPRHLGWDHISRQEIISRNLTIPNSLYGENGTRAILIFDGTYIYIQKSSNFCFQKESYSLHKFRNLLKPFLIVCTDGYIVDVTGPHAATTSDATIMTRSVHDEAPMHIVLQPGDVFVLDRGFRDSLPNIEERGYVAHMPPTKRRNEFQLSTQDANESRMVTLVRWVIEVINGRLKRDFKILRHEYFNRALPHMFDDVKIAAALTNIFKEPLTNTPYANQIIGIIHEKFHQPNLLGDYVVENNINRQRAAFQTITDEAVREMRFPILNEEDLVLIALGTYQIKLARSYLSEHIRNGVYSIEISETAIPNLVQYGIDIQGVLLRGRIKSRHISNRTYYSYILLDTRTTGRESVRHYYCSCLTGRRTVGTCAHIMSIIWYLGWARHQDNILLPATVLDEVIVDLDNL